MDYTPLEESVAAQSGLTSAVGFTIESAWGTAPVTQSGGSGSIGIAGTNPERFFICDPSDGFSAKADLVVPPNEVDADVQVVRTILQSRGYGGSLSHKADPENLYYALLGVSGRDVQTTLAAGAYQHTFTPAHTAPSFTVEEVLGSGSQGRLTTGVVVHTVELDFGPILTAKVSGTGRHAIPNNYLNHAGAAFEDYDYTPAQTVYPDALGGSGALTLALTAAPAFVDVAQTSGGWGNGPLVWASIANGSHIAGAFLAIDGTPEPAATLLPGMKLTFQRKVDVDLAMGSGFDPGAVTGNEWTCEIQALNILFQDNSIAQSHLRHSAISLNFRLNGPPIGSTGHSYSLEIYLPNVQLTENPVKITSGRMLNVGKAAARRDPVLGYAVQVTAVNSFSNASLAGLASANPGGLGGWVNA